MMTQERSGDMSGAFRISEHNLLDTLGSLLLSKMLRSLGVSFALQEA